MSRLSALSTLSLNRESLSALSRVIIATNRQAVKIYENRVILN